MHAFLRKMEGIAKSPYLALLVGLVLMGTALAETGETIFEDVSSGNWSVHHGVIVFGFIHVLKSLPSVLGGLLLIIDAEERQRHKEKQQ